jgi:hypothetical protein
MRPGVALALLGMIFTDFAETAAAQDVAVSAFADKTLKGWASRRFAGETRYILVPDAEAGRTVLRAVSSDSASGLFRKIKIDLSKTPVINWSWKVIRTFPDIDEQTKSGDDFPARIFVVVERGVLGSRSLSLNYVWASRHPTGSDWSSPYTNQVRLFAVDSGAEALGEWVHHKRDVRTDMKEVFGEDITEIDAIALMTDTDDHGGQAETYYGDIWFSEE